MRSSHHIVFTATERKSLFRYVSLSFVLSVMVVTVVAFFDIRDELSEDASELVERLEAIHFEGADIAAKLQQIDVKDCSVSHLQKLQAIFNQQVFIQAIKYRLESGEQCQVGSYTPFVKSERIRSPRGNEIIVNYRSPVDVVSFMAQHGDYQFVYPALISPAFLLVDTNFEIVLSSEALNADEYQYLIGEFGLRRVYAKGQNAWWPDYVVMTESCGEHSDYCAILGFSPRQFAVVFLDWLGIIVAASVAFAYFTYRSLKRKYIRRRSSRSRILRGLKKSFFFCHYQPIVDLASRRIVGCEVLARFEDDYGTMSPLEFIPLIAEAKLTLPFTQLIIDKAMAELAELIDETNSLKVNFNVFPEDFVTDSLWRYVEGVSAKYPLCKLVVEITEDQPLDVGQAITHTDSAQSNGVLIAMDDFGTGYSNLASLQTLNYDILKIDRSFIKGLEFDAIVASLLPNIVEIANKYEMVVVAEGIETEEQLKSLLELGVQQGQGWLFAKPMPIQMLSDHLLLNS